jgi:hypothetical protein
VRFPTPDGEKHDSLARGSVWTSHGKRLPTMVVPPFLV